MSVIWNLISGLYSEISSGIRKDIDSHFWIGLWFAILWIIIVSIIYGLYWLVRYHWISALSLLIVLLIIEFLCWIGKKLKISR